MRKTTHLSDEPVFTTKHRDEVVEHLQENNDEEPGQEFDGSELHLVCEV